VTPHEQAAPASSASGVRLQQFHDRDVSVGDVPGFLPGTRGRGVRAALIKHGAKAWLFAYYRQWARCRLVTVIHPRKKNGPMRPGLRPSWASKEIGGEHETTPWGPDRPRSP